MLDSALAIRTYTSAEILPLLQTRMKAEFLPQGVPFYAATQNILKLREQHPQYAYKEATLNPSNLRDRATDWEADLIQKFRNDPQTMQISGERDTPTGSSLNLARPIRVGAACLECHSTAAAAPQALVARFGSDNGFGWQPNEVAGASIVSVPLASASENADSAFRTIMVWIVVVFLTAVLVVNAVVFLLVVRPVRRIAAVADGLSVGNADARDFPPASGPELTGLTRLFFCLFSC